jgi:hypothetical protein
MAILQRGKIVTGDNIEQELRIIGNELLERWRTAMADGNDALVGETVRTSHAVRNAQRGLLPDQVASNSTRQSRRS